jgi:hypothetical protein
MHTRDRSQRDFRVMTAIRWASTQERCPSRRIRELILGNGVPSFKVDQIRQVLDETEPNRLRSIPDNETGDGRGRHRLVERHYLWIDDVNGLPSELTKQQPTDD